MSPPAIACAVLQWFESSSQCQRKVPPTEWTVLAGIVLHTESSDSFRVLAAATGNKCLGRRDLNVDGLVVNDCHAEVVTRRAFLRYLYAEALHWQANGLETSETSIFELHPTSHRLVLKPQHSLHLFISEAPCGDAAIYELREEVVDELVQQRVARAEKDESKRTEERSEFRLTGAKSHSKRPRTLDTGRDQDAPLDKRFAQAVGIARVKSGRSDLPPDKQTLSMSCSDKLAKWNALGLQGSLLLQWFEPLFLNSIVVSEDGQAMSVTKQQQALQRAVCVRLQERGALLEAEATACQTFVVPNDLPFSRRRAPDLAPSSLSLNWTAKESMWTPASAADGGSTASKEKSTTKPTDADKFAAKFFNSFQLEFLMAATGFKQGAKKASKMDRHAMERVASRLAKRNLLRAFHHVRTAKLSQNSLPDFEYLQLKRAVPLAAPTLSTPSAPTAFAVSSDRRKQFFAAFKDWIGVSTSFKQFKL